VREFLEWAAPWMGGSAGTAFGLGRPDLGWVFAALALGALIGRVALRGRGRVP
jgi:hypothetical protein